jgi:hypothetical protein
LAFRVVSWQCGRSVACGAKQTFGDPRNSTGLITRRPEFVRPRLAPFRFAPARNNNLRRR